MTILSLLLALAVNTMEVITVALPLQNDLKVALSPAGRADLKREGTLTRIRLEVERLQPPSGFGAAFNTYVVWIVSPEGILQNLGELDINKSKGQFSATTPLGQFGIVITAEPHYMVDRPSSAVAYRNQPAADETRRLTVPLEIGTYDYSMLKPGPAGDWHGSVIQARAAFQIAEIAGAERLAEPEFRHARVALGSMEELLTRSAPLDILWPTANEAIRWSQRAVTLARERK